MGTPEMQITSRSSVIGGIPRLEARSTERRGTAHEVFGETIACSKRQPERRTSRAHPLGLATAPRS